MFCITDPDLYDNPISELSFLYCYIVAKNLAGPNFFRPRCLFTREARVWKEHTPSIAKRPFPASGMALRSSS